MYIVKLLSLLFLSLYLIIVGLMGMGVGLSFIPVNVINFFAVAAGVLFLVRAVKRGFCYEGCHRDRDVVEKR